MFDNKLQECYRYRRLASRISRAFAASSRNKRYNQTRFDLLGQGFPCPIKYPSNLTSAPFSGRGEG